MQPKLPPPTALVSLVPLPSAPLQMGVCEQSRYRDSYGRDIATVKVAVSRIVSPSPQVSPLATSKSPHPRGCQKWCVLLIMLLVIGLLAYGCIVLGGMAWSSCVWLVYTYDRIFLQKVIRCSY